eukprot:scaffold1614_cov101-Isochrysis_galbana.AAC.3
MGERSRGCCDSSSLPKGKNVSRVSVSSPMLPRTPVTPLDTVTLPASALRDVVTHAPPPLAASRVRLLRSSAADARTGPLPPLPLPASSPTPSPTFPLSRPACSCGTCAQTLPKSGAADAPYPGESPPPVARVGTRTQLEISDRGSIERAQVAVSHQAHMNVIPGGGGTA